MSRFDDERRAMARAEADWLREPEWRTGEGEGDEDELAALVRRDIAETARSVGLRCVAAVVEAEPDADGWAMVRNDLRDRSRVERDSDHVVALMAMMRAAHEMGSGNVEAAVRECSELVRMSPQEWAAKRG